LTKTAISYTCRHIDDKIWPGVFVKNVGRDFLPYSLISQNYSTYLGIKVDTTGLTELAEFRFARHPFTDYTVLPNQSLLRPSDSDVTDGIVKFIQTGHLATVFNSSKGLLDSKDLIDIYKYDSNKPYFAISDRLDISKTSVDVFRGDGFINRFFKRITYKAGVGEVGANAGDAGVFKIGLSDKMKDSEAAVPPEYLDDKGRNLFDLGLILEIDTLSNVNADIRSVEHVDDTETTSVGYDRDFYPHMDNMYSDPRPDSQVYNQGYSPDNFVIPYFRLEESMAAINTTYPNRIFISEKNKVQEFYNSFRALRGFNFKDYGVSFGEIVKIEEINGLLLSVHTKGVLGIAVDDRTLVSKDSNVFIDTAEALSPKPAVLSNLFGSIHPESIIKTSLTIIGVDYNSDAVWMFSGNKVILISEFAIKMFLKLFKSRIVKGEFLGNDPDITYVPRVYSTFNVQKSTVYITYVAEHPESKEQVQVGTLTYNTVLNKWVSRISDGNKFLMRLFDSEYSLGFSSKPFIWKEDSLKDSSTGEYLRSNLRGTQYNTEFEIIINEYPTYEKILENIIVLCNKRIPTKLIFKTSGDVNDPAVDIWGSEAETTTTEQMIVVRGDSPRKAMRLGILDQNAYYKQSKLYMEVGKVKYSIKDNNNKRIRDKHFKVRFIYEGSDELFIQAIISILSIS